jgi:xanthine phosphoribosyltransferase
LKLLEDRIRTEGKIYPGNIVKVDGFINQRIDIELLREIGKEFCRLFEDSKINKVITIEASGIAFACAAAMEIGCDVVFAKKSGHKNIGNDVYTEKVISFTKGKEYDIVISKEHLTKGDRVLIIDDFLAEGNASRGLVRMVQSADAEVVGVGIVIEKGFQSGGKELRKNGVRVESLAIIDNIEEDRIIFR